MNQVILMGRLTRDPELRHTQTGTPVASFTLAVDRGFKDKDSGERQTDFIDCVAWRQTAEFVTKYFVKGQLAAVSGKLQIRDWVDKDNNKRRNAEVVAENVYFTGDRRDNSAGSVRGGAGVVGGRDKLRPPGEASAVQEGYYSGAYTSQPQQPWNEHQGDDGDLPF